MVRLARILLVVAAVGCGFTAAAVHGDSEAPSQGPRLRFEETGPFTAEQLTRQAEEELRAVTSGAGRGADLADAAHQIETWIREQGYPNVLVSFEMFRTGPSGRTRVRSSDAWHTVDLVTFTVDPGEQVYLGSISLGGVDAFAHERLIELFTTGDRTPYVRRVIDEGVAGIERLYSSEGYVRREVGPVEIVRIERNDTVFYDLEIPVREGPRFTIRGVLVVSPELSTDRLESLRLNLDLIGLPFFPRRAAEGALLLRRLLGSEGYDAAVNYETELDEDGRTTIVYRVDPGPLLVVDAVEVGGMDGEELRTRTRFLRSFLELEAGDFVDFGELRRTESRIYGLGIFTFVSVTAEPGLGSQEPRPTTIVIEVQERRSRFVELQAGWGSYEQLRGAASFIDRNFFGLGRFWSVSAYASFRTYGVETSLSDRIIFGPQSTVTLLALYDYRDSPAFDRTTIEAELSFAYDIDRTWSFGAGYSFAQTHVKNIDGEIPGAEIPDLAVGRIVLSVQYDSRDSVVLPTIGAYVRTSPFVSLPILGSGIGFAGGSIDARYHLMPADRVTVVFSGNYSSCFRIDGGELLPIQYRLFLGGPNSVRAFGIDELGLVNAEGSPRGGLSSIQVTTEVSVRLIAELYAAAFYDAGFLSLSAFSTEGDFGHGFGAGLRYHLPVGPVRLDLAYNPGELYAATRRWAAHFAVGFSY